MKKEKKLSLLKITAYGDPILRRQAERVDGIDDDFRKLIQNMLETLHAAGGIGLAAPQIGISKMFLVIDWSQLNDENDPKKQEGFTVYVNPVIHGVGGNRTPQEEACLSLPKISAEVSRADNIEISYETLDGEEVKEELIGYHARVFQHEYDHLLGILFIDRISPAERKKLKTKLQDILAGRIKPFDGTETSEPGS